MKRSESIKQIAVALGKFQAEVGNPKHTANNPYFKSKYTPLHDVINHVQPILAKYGLTVLQNPSGDGKSVAITTLLMHESGEWIESTPLMLQAEKLTPQGAGAAITYGRRYSLSAMLGIATEDDDDGNSLEGRPQARQGRGAQPTKPAGPAKTKAKETISPRQARRMFAMAGDDGAEAIVRRVLGEYGCERSTELLRADYDEACEKIRLVVQELEAMKAAGND